MRPLKTLPAALALVGVLALATTAWAGPEEGEDSIEAKIKAQMDKIIKLMEENDAPPEQFERIGLVPSSGSG